MSSMSHSVRKVITLGYLHEKFEGLCFYCNCKTFLPGSAEALDRPDRLATREHLIRQADGGGHGDNIVLACRACNVGREDRTVNDWKQLRSWLGKRE